MDGIFSVVSVRAGFVVVQLRMPVVAGGMTKHLRSAKGFPAVLLHFDQHKMASCLQEVCE